MFSNTFDVDRYQESEERLFVENLKLKNEIKEQTTDFKDINAYLNLQLNKKTARVQELETENGNLEKRLKQTSHDSEVLLKTIVYVFLVLNSTLVRAFEIAKRE